MNTETHLRELGIEWDRLEGDNYVTIYFLGDIEVWRDTHSDGSEYDLQDDGLDELAIRYNIITPRQIASQRDHS